MNANFLWTFEIAMGAIFVCLVLMVLVLALLLSCWRLCISWRSTGIERRDDEGSIQVRAS
jgi:hypothetical protein